jgi:putative phosphoesterase
VLLRAESRAPGPPAWERDGMGGHRGELGTVAVLSDVHGVLPVLEAVLDEPDVRAADAVVVTGDHAAGPQPVVVLDRLRALGDRAVLVRGNADRDLVAHARDGSGPVPDPVTPWAAAQLRPADVELLAGLPHPVELRMRGFGRVVACHGTPRDDEEVVLVDSSLERWAQALGGLDDDVATVLCGHTHMPFVRLVDRRLVVNPGSVGMPYGRPGGSWALLRDGQVELRHTPVDVDAAVAAVAAGSAYPGARAWADEYLRSAASDADALRVFGPRDGRAARPAERA